MIISDDDKLTNELIHLTKVLIARGYPLDTINTHIYKALKFDQRELIFTNKAHSNTSILPLVIIIIIIYDFLYRINTFQCTQHCYQYESCYKLKK